MTSSSIVPFTCEKHQGISPVLRPEEFTKHCFKKKAKKLSRKKVFPVPKKAVYYCVYTCSTSHPPLHTTSHIPFSLHTPTPHTHTHTRNTPHHHAWPHLPHHTSHITHTNLTHKHSTSDQYHSSAQNEATELACHCHRCSKHLDYKNTLVSPHVTTAHSAA